ncbi:MAG: dihydrodipicolinate synthase family protein [Acidobacteriota bacterium]|nr:dihydrodipicolinate synthase family protein [Acidobacteriota bacterium]
MTSNLLEMDRRTLLKTMGSMAGGTVLSRFAMAALPSARAFNGLFPIASTPFTQDNKLDLDCLNNEVKFCNKGGVPGLIWPQIASGWTTLSAAERLAGAESMIAAGKGGKTAIVIGVQTQNKDLPGAIAYAKHAAKNGADAICSLPPDGDSVAIFDYYKAIGAATDLPLFIQTIGDMPVDLVVRMFKEIPTVRVVKDEAGDPLARVTEMRAKTDGKLAVFAGKGVRQMMDEMRLGFTGFCPVVGLADVFQEAWELYQAGKLRESYDMFGRIQAFSTITNADRYLMVARGIFKDDTKSRPTPGMGNAGGAQPPLTGADKKAVREALDMYLKPYLRA